MWKSVKIKAVAPVEIKDAQVLEAEDVLQGISNQEVKDILEVEEAIEVETEEVRNLALDVLAMLQNQEAIGKNDARKEILSQ